jgi:hypothetical protein
VSKGRHIRSLANYGSTGRWGVALIGFFFLTVPALGNGVIVSGFKADGTTAVTVAVSRSSVKNATARAIADCQKTASACRVLHTFSKSCVATVLFASRQLDIGTGATVEAAQQEAMRICQARGGPCAPQYSACDPPPAGAPTEPQPATADVSALVGLFVLLLIAAVAGYLWHTERLAFSWWRSPAPLPAPSPTTPRQTEAAVRELKAAWSHIESATAQLRDGSKRTYESTEHTTETLNLAAEHLARAHELDAGACLDIDGQPVNQNQLMGRLFAFEGMAQTVLADKAVDGFQGRKHLRTAAAAFQQAAAYDPQPGYFVGLSEVYAMLNR